MQSMCCAGLLGGAVYVNAFTLLAKEVEPSLREFSLAAASLADSVGIALADICGILVQASPQDTVMKVTEGQAACILFAKGELGTRHRTALSRIGRFKWGQVYMRRRMG